MILLLIKASVIVAFLIMFYKLFLEKESFYAANRIYLLACLILTCMLPFVDLPKIVDHQGILTSWVKANTPEVNSTNIDKTVVKPENVKRIEVTPTVKDQYAQQDRGTNISSVKSVITSQNKTYNISYYIMGFYLFGVFVFLVLFFIQIFSLIKSIYQATDKIFDTNCTIVNLNFETEPCSFFRFVFISPQSYDYQTYERILKHEQIHVRLYHSLDLILAELAIVILWFNPFIWLLRKEVEKNIEYQTDHILINDKNVDKQSYQMSLLGLATKMKPLNLTTYYNQSLIKQRILKMNSKKSNPFGYCKYAFILPLIFTLLLVVNQPLEGLANDLSIETKKAYLNASELPSTITVTSLNDMISDTRNENEDHYAAHLPSLNCADLTLAIRNKDIAKVKQLLTKIDPNCIDPNPPYEIIEMHPGLTMRRRHAAAPLIAAARIGHIEIAKLLLEAGADVNIEDKQELPILAAANDGHKDFIAFLIDEKADKYIYTRGYGNALHCASRNGHLDAVNYLIEQGLNLNKNGDSHGTPLNCAARNGHDLVVSTLIDAGADINLESDGQGSALNAASRNNHVEVVKILLDEGVEINAQTNGQGTALNAAARNGHLETLKFLLDEGGLINFQNNGQGSALNAAARNGYTNVVEFLIEKGAEIDAQTNGQGTALNAAARNGHLETVKYLLDNGSAIDVQNDGQGSALNAAARNGHINVVEFLLESGAGIDVQNDGQGTALNAAARNGHVNVVEFLLDKGAGIDVQNDGQGTALNAAARNGHVSVVEFLLDEGAGIDVQNDGQGSALNAAARNGHRDVVELLIERGAQIDLRSNGQSTALDAARRNGHNSIARFLESKSAKLKNFELYQNEPNPFRTITVIGFDLPKAVPAILTVMNVEGEIVKTINGDFEKGYNEIKLNKSDLINNSNYSDVLYYQLECEKFKATKKMILIESN